MSEQERHQDPVVLIALDGSPAAATAVPAACTIAAQLGARVEALHVRKNGTNSFEAKLELSAPGTTVRYATGDPVEEIVRASQAPEVVLVVLATHGRAIRRGRALAGIPRRVAAGTNQPVLLIRPEATGNGAECPPLRRLLFPIDGTPTTATALAPAAELAARLGAEIDVLFVVHPQQAVPDERGTMTTPYYVDQPQYEWPAWRARVAKWMQCQCENLPRETVIHAHIASAQSRDDIGNAIAQFAIERNDDGIILVRRSQMEHGRAPILRAVFDRAPCPVLLVPGPSRQQRAPAATADKDPTSVAGLIGSAPA